MFSFAIQVSITCHQALKIEFLMNIYSIVVFLMESIINFFSVCKFPFPLLDVRTAKYGGVELTFLNAF